ncbi:DUF2551 domain-containing protein [Methanolapillus millepedarum]|uniref:DUF2551 domain-containing protein n=1 Tax=Methanolapillus millepedarum TaxID=3028296 RepID=A0AA96V1V5_9EURY|nr:hypothetical protein MsAc7_03810 [Methanosarcinaceae archaeon Ac7]
MSLKASIMTRLEKFVAADVTGYRKKFLDLVIKCKEFTVDQIHDLISKEYAVTRNEVASMVGYIQSKVGILKSHKESYKTPIVYTVKDEYIDIIKLLVGKSPQSVAGI